MHSITLTSVFRSPGFRHARFPSFKNNQSYDHTCKAAIQILDMRFFHRFHLSPLSLSVDKARTSNNHYNHSIMTYIILSTWLSLYHSTCFLFFFCSRYCSIRRLYKLMYHPLSVWISCWFHCEHAG